MESTHTLNFGTAGDDVFVHAGPANTMAPVTKPMAQAIFCEYTRAGLDLHLHAKNTCAVFSMVGEGKQAAMQEMELLVRTEKGIAFEVMGKQLVMPVASQYKHVGCTPAYVCCATLS